MASEARMSGIPTGRRSAERLAGRPCVRAIGPVADRQGPPRPPAARPATSGGAGSWWRRCSWSAPSLLGISLSVRPGDAVFYPLTLARGRDLDGRRPAVRAAAPRATSRPRRAAPTGRHADRARAGLRPPCSSLGALVVREIPPLRDYVENVLAHARHGVARAGRRHHAGQRRRRGGVLPRRRCSPRSAGGTRCSSRPPIYAVATLATGNPMLVFAAVTLGSCSACSGGRPAASCADPHPRHLVDADAVRAAAAVRLRPFSSGRSV